MSCVKFEDLKVVDYKYIAIQNECKKFEDLKVINYKYIAIQNEACCKKPIVKDRKYYLGCDESIGCDFACDEMKDIFKSGDYFLFRKYTKQEKFIVLFIYRYLEIDNFERDYYLGKSKKYKFYGDDLFYIKEFNDKTYTTINEPGNKDANYIKKIEIETPKYLMKVYYCFNGVLYKGIVNNPKKEYLFVRDKINNKFYCVLQDYEKKRYYSIELKEYGDCK